jgi:hypothetical protein
MNVTPNLRIAMASASTAELLDELLKRGVLKHCTGSMFVDGRVASKIGDPVAFRLYVEARLLEVMARGLAAAAPTDKVHSYSEEPAGGDYAPGTIFAKVDMFAVAVEAK